MFILQISTRRLKFIFYEEFYFLFRWKMHLRIVIIKNTFSCILELTWLVYQQRKITSIRMDWNILRFGNTLSYGLFALSICGRFFVMELQIIENRYCNYQLDKFIFSPSILETLQLLYWCFTSLPEILSSILNLLGLVQKLFQNGFKNDALLKMSIEWMIWNISLLACLIFLIY